MGTKSRAANPRPWVTHFGLAAALGLKGDLDEAKATLAGRLVSRLRSGRGFHRLNEIAAYRLAQKLFERAKRRPLSSAATQLGLRSGGGETRAYRALLRRPGQRFIVNSDGGLLRLSRRYGEELFIALFDAASPLVPGNGGADMVRASALACGGDFSLRPAGCQSKNLIAQI